MDNEANQPSTSGTNWTPAATYVMATVCLLIGVLVGYVVRGSAPTASPQAAATEAAAPAGAPAMPAGMGGGTAPHAAPSLDDMKRMADKKAEPLLAKLKTDPNNAEILNDLGILYRATHQFKEAEGYYEKSLQIDPKNVKVRTDLASCLYYTGDVDGALAQLNKSLTYDPKDPYAHYALGLSYFKKAVTANSFAELSPALLHFRAALEINADMVEAGYAKQNIALIEKVQAAQRN